MYGSTVKSLTTSSNVSSVCLDMLHPRARMQPQIGLKHITAVYAGRSPAYVRVKAWSHLERSRCAAVQYAAPGVSSPGQ